MKLCSKFLVILVLVTVCFAMISCAGPANAGSSYKNVTVSLTFYPICNGCFIGGTYYGVNPPGAGGITGTQICSPASTTCLANQTETCNPTVGTCFTAGAIEMPVGGGSGGCIELLTTVTNAPFNPTYTITPAPVTTSATSNVGTIGNLNGNTAYYCEAGSIPVYSGVQLAQAQAAGLPMGTTEVTVTNPADPNDPTKIVSASLYFAFQQQTPSTGIVAGILPSGNVIVPLGGTFQFTGYIAGNNGFVVPAGATAPTGGCTAAIAGICIPAYQATYNVNTVIGGAGPYGTISSTGLYTAPLTYPIVSGAAVKTASITVTPASYPTSSIVSSTTTVTFP